MTSREELYLFIHAVFGTNGSTRGLYCDECKKNHPEGGNLSFTNYNGKQIVECCFEKVFGPIKKLIDSRRQCFFEYLLEQFEKNPLDTEWEFIRSMFLPNAILKWQQAVEKEKIKVEKCTNNLPVEN